MKKSLFRFSSRRILFSTVIASALIAGSSQTVFADAGEMQVVLQTGAIKGKIVDSYGAQNKLWHENNIRITM